MNARSYLKQYEEACRRIKRYEMEYNEECILIDAVKSLSDNDGMPHGTGISNPTADKAVKLVDKALKIYDAKRDAIRIRQEVFEFIDGIEGIEGDVLYFRYVQLMKWEAIANKIHYSYQGVMQIRRRALEIAQKKLDETI